MYNFQLQTCNLSSLLCITLLHFCYYGLLLKKFAKKIFLAEREGFEPSVPFSTTVFETAPFNRSGTSPKKHLSAIKKQKLFKGF